MIEITFSHRVRQTNNVRLDNHRRQRGPRKLRHSPARRGAPQQINYLSKKGFKNILKSLSLLKTKRIWFRTTTLQISLQFLAVSRLECFANYTRKTHRNNVLSPKMTWSQFSWSTYPLLKNKFIEVSSKVEAQSPSLW